MKGLSSQGCLPGWLRRCPELVVASAGAEIDLFNPTHPYIVFHDAPKVARLKSRYPGMYRAQWTAQLAGAPAKAANVR